MYTEIHNLLGRKDIAAHRNHPAGRDGFDHRAQPLGRLVVHHDDLQSADEHRRLRLRPPLFGADDLAIGADRPPVGRELEAADLARRRQRALMRKRDAGNAAVGQKNTRVRHLAADGGAHANAGVASSIVVHHSRKQIAVHRAPTL